MVSKRAAVQTVGRPACTAVGACAIAVGEGSDHKVPFVEGMDIWPDLFNNTDELVADGTQRMRGQTAVVPQVGTTDASQYHTNDSISRLLNLRVRSLAKLNGTGPIKNCCFHPSFASSFDTSLGSLNSRARA